MIPGHTHRAWEREAAPSCIAVRAAKLTLSYPARRTCSALRMAAGGKSIADRHWPLGAGGGNAGWDREGWR